MEEEDELGGAAAVADPEDGGLAVGKDVLVCDEVVEDVLVIRRGSGAAGVEAGLGG